MRSRLGSACLLLVALAAGTACERQLTLEEALEASWQNLPVETVTRLPEARKGGVAVLFLHGYGRDGPHYELLAREILDDETRVFLPTAALPHARGGAMWWEFIEGDWPKPYSDDPSANAWPKPSKQLPRAREAVPRLIAWVRSEYRPDVLVLAGHSQGAMLALDVAMVAEPPVDRVAALSGYVLLDSVGNIEKPRDERPRVLVSHGRGDELVAFSAAERMERLLTANGFDVTLAPHEGAHRINAAASRDLRAFVRGSAPGG